MWKLLCTVIVVAVLSTYADADRERGQRAIRNRRIHIPNLKPPFYSSVKGQEAIVIESEFLGYNYSTPKTETDGYVYTPGGYVYTPGGYVYVTPTTTREPSTKPSPPGTTYLPPGTTYLPPPTTTPTTTTTTSTTTPTTTTTTSTTTRSTTPSIYLPPKRYTYLPPPEPPKKYLPPVKVSYPPVNYTRISRVTATTTTHFNNYSYSITPTTPRPTPSKPIGYYKYLPPEYLPAFETRK